MNPSFESWRTFIFDPARTFEQKAESVFRHQLRHLPCYRRFCAEIGMEMPEASDIIPESSRRITPADIPLMPVQAFRDTRVRAGYLTAPQTVFRSSGTAGMHRAVHEIADLTLYEESCYRGFARFYDPEEFMILACLPGYTDNPDSSLIAMIDSFIRRDVTGRSRFLPLDRPLTEADFTESLGPVSRSCLSQPSHLSHQSQPSRRIMLFGAAFGLLDLVQQGAPNPQQDAPNPQQGALNPQQGAPNPQQGALNLPPGSVVVETGGMKTRRREISREELHQRLAEGFGLPLENIHSEYGMAEMCSQAWDPGEGWFRCPPWLRISIRDPENPLRELQHGEEGLIGVLDLANVHSLAFFLTQDHGVARPDGSFRVFGRWDHAELRGCNFLMD